MNEATKQARADYPEEDARIVACVAEIQAALKKHDCAALVSLSTEHRMEFLRELAPSWSCAWIERLPDGQLALRIRAKAADFPSKEAQKKVVEDTCGMIFGFFYQAHEDKQAMANVIMMLKDHFKEIENFIETYQRVAAK